MTVCFMDFHSSYYELTQCSQWLAFKRFDHIQHSFNCDVIGACSIWHTSIEVTFSSFPWKKEEEWIYIYLKKCKSLNLDIKNLLFGFIWHVIKFLVYLYIGSYIIQTTTRKENGWALNQSKNSWNASCQTQLVRPNNLGSLTVFIQVNDSI